MRVVRLEKHLEHSLCLYPELIDDDLWGIRQGMECLGPNYPTLRRQDRMPNRRLADMVFVEHTRVTVVEIKKGPLNVRHETQAGEDVVEQSVDYLRQCRRKYPGKSEYRAFIVGTAIPDRHGLFRKISRYKEMITPLILGIDIPMTIKFCRCGRALGYRAMYCRCGARCS
ncbi:MAG: hypothetical protein RDU20_14775 [Desulfomonilaceae bacterium]|nr:hypothetical protein [Desulfomonilaceae bacterium]